MLKFNNSKIFIKNKQKVILKRIYYRVIILIQFVDYKISETIVSEWVNYSTHLSKCIKRTSNIFKTFRLPTDNFMIVNISKYVDYKMFFSVIHIQTVYFV